MGPLRKVVLKFKFKVIHTRYTCQELSLASHRVFFDKRHDSLAENLSSTAFHWLTYITKWMSLDALLVKILEKKCFHS